MSLNENERLVCEAIDTMLKHEAQLGLKMHNDKHENLGETERGYEYLHNQIDDMFTLKAAELTHSDGVCQAFSKVHSYKYLDDPSFKTAMKKEMVAQGIPAAEREEALGYIEPIIKKLAKEQADWAEKDFGFNPALDEISDMDELEQPLDFNEEEVEDWPTESNVDFEEGDASPGKAYK